MLDPEFTNWFYIRFGRHPSYDIDAHQLAQEAFRAGKCYPACLGPAGFRRQQELDFLLLNGRMDDTAPSSSG